MYVTGGLLSVFCVTKHILRDSGRKTFLLEKGNYSARDKGDNAHLATWGLLSDFVRGEGRCCVIALPKN